MRLPSLLPLLFILSLLTGCARTTAPPVFGQLPLSDIALGSLAGIAESAESFASSAVSRLDVTGCVVSSSLRDASSTGLVAIRAADETSLGIEGTTISLADCRALADELGVSVVLPRSAAWSFAVDGVESAVSFVRGWLTAVSPASEDCRALARVAGGLQYVEHLPSALYDVFVGDADDVVLSGVDWPYDVCDVPGLRFTIVPDNPPPS
jgi:hypothetical protein